MVNFLCGAGAGLGSKTMVYPLDMVKKRLQVQGFEHGRVGFGKNKKYLGFLHCLRTIVLEEGLTGFYKGLSPSILKALMTAGSHFAVYEAIVKVIRAYS